MGQRNISLSIGEYYHVYNRGTDKRTIFVDGHDYKRFVELLFLCNSAKSINTRNIHRDYNSVFNFEKGDCVVAIGAYCLMPNHFHILLIPLVENGATTFMGKLGTSYSMYFNKKYKRNGSLFQGKFKAEHVQGDEYLKYLYSYIHLNPVKLISPKWREEGIKDVGKAFQYLKRYQYSSFIDYVGNKRTEAQIINNEVFPEYFRNSEDIEKELIEWLKFETV